jgi:hypothetical protein
MSSPIHHPEDLDAALMYAPPWARDGARDRARDQSPPLAPVGPATAVPVELPPRRRFGADRLFSGDLAMARLQRQLSLHPDEVPEPPFDDGESLLPLLGRIGAVAGIAALVAWLLVSVPGARLLRNDIKPAGFTPVSLAVNTDKEDSARVATALLVQHGLAAAAIQPQNVLPQNVLPQNVLPQPPAASPFTPPPMPTPPDTNSPATESVSLSLDNAEIATLVKRGKDFLTNGDLSSARLLLRRAAGAGSAEAALALGASFDPLVIRRLGAIGAQPDTARARQWYQKAVELGSEAASQQLAKLTQSGQ